MTPTLEGLPVHRLCSENNGCILVEEMMERCCSSDQCLLLNETRDATRAAYERAAEIANEVEAEMDRRLAKLKPPNADLASACAVGAGWATAKVSARILALKEPT